MNFSQLKDFFREIKKSYTRFLSILCMVALGVAFFVGIRSAEPDMRITADDYYDKTNFHDIRVVGTLGLTDDDVENIKKIDGITDAKGAYKYEAMNIIGSSEHIFTVYSITDGMNNLVVNEGRLPENETECFADEWFVNSKELKIGDEIKLFSGTDEDIFESLKYDTFTIVGYGNYPGYLSWERGSAGVGDGDVDAFLFIPKEAFAMEVYTDIYATVDDCDKFVCYDDDYQDKIDEIVERIEDIADARCKVRYDSVQTEGNDKINDGLAEIADARKKLDDAKVELDDAKIKLDDGKVEIDDAKVKLEDGRIELDDAKLELEDGLIKIEDAKKEIADGEIELAKAQKEIDDAKAELDNARKQLDDGWTEYNKNLADYEDGAKQIKEAKEVLEESEKELNAGKLEYEQGKQQLEEAKVQLDALKVQIDEYKQLLEALKQGNPLGNPSLGTGLESPLGDINQGIGTGNLIGSNEQGISTGNPLGDINLEELEAMYNSKLEEWNQANIVLQASYELLVSSEKQLESGKLELANKESELLAGKEKLDEALVELENGEKDLSEATKEFEEGLVTFETEKQKLVDGKEELRKAELEYEDGRIKYLDGEEEYNENLQKLEEAETDYNDGKKEYDDALKTYNEKSNEAEIEIADANEKIEDAKEKLADIEFPEWYVLDRNAVQTYVEFGLDSERIGAIGKLFPVIFFLVAALVSLTTMTRMVEEERMQIGTMKALGYGKFSIASKYLIYALLACAVGSVIGVIVGSTVLPYVIVKAYAILYIGITGVITPINLGISILAITCANLCTLIATFAACYKELLSTPAILMRPPSPKMGKRVFVENIGFIWKRLNFTRKATVRNLLRYKKRFFMTVIGIGGCMGLLMVSFGLQDSIKEIVNNQYRTLWVYDAHLSVDGIVEGLEDEISEYDLVDECLYSRNVTTDVRNNDLTKSAILFIPKDLEKFPDFIKLHSRTSKEKYSISEDGVVINEKLANLLSLEVGDSFEIKKTETEYVKAKVSAITENYLYNYIYMSESFYENTFGEEVEYNQLLLKTKKLSDEDKTKLGTDMLEKDKVKGIQIVSDLEETVNNMMNSLNLVIWVLIISAMLLAFVVLYNLNNINIIERKRELATIKVLGFYDGELAAYVYRENILLTIIGIVVGVFMGLILHQFVIKTCEIDMIMFGRSIKPLSYVYCILLTWLFSAIVNFVMLFKLKNIDMVESLKSVE